MATILTNGIIARAEADTWAHAFQSPNITPYQDPSLIMGNFFIGLQSTIFWKFTGHGIPRGAQIESALIDMDAAFTSGVGTKASRFTISDMSGHRSEALLDNTFGPAWRAMLWGRFKVILRNSPSSIITDTLPSIATNGAWAIRWQNNSAGGVMNDQMAQRITLGASPGVLGSAQLQLNRVGAPAGNMQVQIAAVTTVNGLTVPGSILASSNTITASSIPLTPGLVTFNFSGANQISLPANTDVFLILRSTLPYNVDGTNFINWHQQRAFFGAGGGRHYGTGVDFDFQNFPGAADVYQVQSVEGLTPTVPWDTPPFTAGNTYQSPDLTALVQHAVSRPTYNDGGPIVVSWIPTNTNNLNRRIASFNHPTLNSAELVVTYRQRRIWTMIS